MARSRPRYVRHARISRPERVLINLSCMTGGFLTVTCRNPSPVWPGFRAIPHRGARRPRDRSSRSQDVRFVLCLTRVSRPACLPCSTVKRLAGQNCATPFPDHLTGETQGRAPDLDGYLQLRRVHGCLSVPQPLWFCLTDRIAISALIMAMTTGILIWKKSRRACPNAPSQVRPGCRNLPFDSVLPVQRRSLFAITDRKETWFLRPHEAGARGIGQFTFAGMTGVPTSDSVPSKGSGPNRPPVSDLAQAASGQVEVHRINRESHHGPDTDGGGFNGLMTRPLVCGKCRANPSGDKIGGLGDAASRPDPFALTPEQSWLFRSGSCEACGFGCRRGDAAGCSKKLPHRRVGGDRAFFALRTILWGRVHPLIFALSTQRTPGQTGWEPWHLQPGGFPAPLPGRSTTAEIAFCRAHHDQEWASPVHVGLTQTRELPRVCGVQGGNPTPDCNRCAGNQRGMTRPRLNGVAVAIFLPRLRPDGPARIPGQESPDADAGPWLTIAGHGVTLRHAKWPRAMVAPTTAAIFDSNRHRGTSLPRRITPASVIGTSGRSPLLRYPWPRCAGTADRILRAGDFADRRREKVAGASQGKSIVSGLSGAATMVCFSAVSGERLVLSAAGPLCASAAGRPVRRGISL